MKTRSTILTAVPLVLCSTLSVSAAEVWKKVGAWTVWFHSETEDGCYAERRLPGDGEFFLGYGDSLERLIVSVTLPSVFKMDTNSPIRTTWDFTPSGSWTVGGTLHETEGKIKHTFLSNQQKFLSQIQKNYSVTLTVGNAPPIEIGLEGSLVAVDSMLSCHMFHKDKIKP